MFQEEKNKLYEEYAQALLNNEKAYKALKMEQEVYKQTHKHYLKSENDVKALQTVGHIIGEVLEKLSDEKFIVKSSQGPRYVVGCMKAIDRKKITTGTRVALDITTLTIMVVLPREVDPMIHSMGEESPGDGISFESVGGLKDQIRELREVIELPLKNPDIFKRIGVRAPKGVLLYGPPGTGKTLLARIVAATMDVNFLKVVSSALIEKYIGESSRMIREMFAYARRKAPCIIFMDEIDAIGGKRSRESSSSDREVQRTLMELLNQLDGFNELDNVKVIMATNRPDILDPALLRPGRLDRKIEIPLPNEQGRKEILKIHSRPMNAIEEIDYDSLVKLTAGFNGADLRNVCTEAGMIALKDERDYVKHEDFVKSARKIADAKKLETRLDYKRK
ncbi:ATP-dependent 26S proteasome regulatory subunit [Encephalitozoon hellem]|uniref:26S proteasome regulatory subunit 6A n=1 Tax=Encephalitozoon hellem TaxID=27973 RepID=A0A9Q9C4I2_ENCHE|nr:ATP-dependent 26S proteasome regulatory subunit [Encephalitozoon hellem ATCC 50504]AFM98542.1 ATP-dependent 26S proteasome regulatory subunit [Encephalitozoon hellem ATCC 50504]KAG5858596.1 ATP-dependent 26S proteasome regulatory subunit [Encephalitozoon hellem]UTX43485.1 26S proteasome regulatory subunit 6A [Encephalitozoon hellem]WEL38959.1 26S proteasome subunit P45 [Encephalitozoon hellem]|eukprot:XP_003887523.1 ATP-dependent 26S proteasome regulatory subunit [Encephalitozoon hellem ATCC 50504]